MLQKTINQELHELELFLSEHPEESFDLAIAHLEDFLILRAEYNHLKAHVKQSPHFPLQRKFIDARLTIEQKFEVEKLKRYLIKYPKKAINLALTYFYDFLVLGKYYEQLKYNNFAESHH